MKPYRRLTIANLLLPVAILAAATFAYAWWELKTAAEKEPMHINMAKVPGELAAPVFREFVTPEGTLLEMRVPYDPLQIGISTERTCWIWRDARTPTASLSCPSADPAVIPGN